MKIIYIPIVIPVNIRTLVALVLCVLGVLCIGLAVATESWLKMEMQTDGSGTRVTKIVAYQSLQYVNVYLCRPSARFQVEFCSTTHVVYTQCDDANDAWCVGRAGFLATMGTGILAVLVGLTSLGVGFVWELFHGYVAGLAAFCSVAGTITYATGYKAAVSGGLLAAIYAEAKVDHGLVTHSLGYSFYAYLLGTVVLCCAAALSSSLHCCAAHGDANRARQAPKIQLVEMDARGSTEIATIAPQPGFVRLDGRNNMTDDDDDLITVPPPLNDASPIGRAARDVAEETTHDHPDPTKLVDLPHAD